MNFAKKKKCTCTHKFKVNVLYKGFHTIITLPIRCNCYTRVKCRNRSAIADVVGTRVHGACFDDIRRQDVHVIACERGANRKNRGFF